MDKKELRKGVYALSLGKFFVDKDKIRKKVNLYEAKGK